MKEKGQEKCLNISIHIFYKVCWENFDESLIFKPDSDKISLPFFIMSNHDLHISHPFISIASELYLLWRVHTNT